MSTNEKIRAARVQLLILSLKGLAIVSGNDMKALVENALDRVSILDSIELLILSDQKLAAESREAIAGHNDLLKAIQHILGAFKDQPDPNPTKKTLKAIKSMLRDIGSMEIKVHGWFTDDSIPIEAQVTSEICPPPQPLLDGNSLKK